MSSVAAGGHTTWLVGRAGREDLQISRQSEVKAWLERLGLDPARFLLQLAVTQRGDTYALHLTELLRDEQGHPYLDIAADMPAQRPHVLQIEPGSWPTWLAGLGNRCRRPATP